MVAEMTDVKGIGPSKAETLEEHGYDSVESLANADPEELAEVKGVGSDRALEYKVGAENLIEAEEELEEETGGDSFDLTPAEVSDEIDSEDADDDVSESDDEDDAEDSDDEEDADDDSDEPETEPEYEVVFNFNNQMHYDVFHAALMRHNERVSHQPATDLMEKCLSGLYGNEKEVTYMLTEYELNTLHAAVKQTRTNYQGANDIAQMDALKEVEAQLDEARSEYLF
jgi:hypothetical protein